MVALDRRAWLMGAASTTFTAFKTPSGDLHPSSFSLSQAMELVSGYSPTEFRKSVMDSGHFLYRGETVRGPTLLHPQPDLLLPGTYGDDPDALKYFECLERQLSSRTQARPSTGHIGTGNSGDASLWGSPVSVWPLGDRFSYVWPKQRDLIYPGGVCPDEDGLRIDSGLSTALEQNKEVLFASWFEQDRNLPMFATSSFVAIPSSYDEEVRDLLFRRRYWL